MSRPKIRHLAMFVRDPDKVAKFYCDVFKMDVAHKTDPTKTEGKAWFLTDGYMSLAILPQRLEGEAACGLNHFGFAKSTTSPIFRRNSSPPASRSRRSAPRPAPTPNIAAAIPKAIGSTSRSTASIQSRPTPTARRKRYWPARSNARPIQTRHCEEQGDEAIQSADQLDCFAALAMTMD